MQSVEPWRAAVPVVRALQLPIFAPNHDYSDEDDEEENDEVENDDDEYDDQMRVLQLPILRILLKQDTALLSNVSQCVSVLVTGVTSQVFSII